MSAARHALGLEEEPRVIDSVLFAAIEAAPLSEHEREILRYLGEKTEASVDDVRRTGRLRVRRIFSMCRASHAEIRQVCEGLQARDVVVVEPDAGHAYLWIWRLAPDVLGVLARLVLEATP